MDVVILSNSKYLLSGCVAWNLLPEYSHANGTAACCKKQLLHKAMFKFEKGTGDWGIVVETLQCNVSTGRTVTRYLTDAIAPLIAAS
nr:hypothetical protein [Nostoc sp. CreGUA01]